MSLSNRKVGCVVITGGTKGIGLALAHAFLELGCSVVIAGRNLESLNHALSYLKTHFNKEKFTGLCCDVTQISDLQNLWDVAIQHFLKSMYGLIMQEAATLPRTLLTFNLMN